MADLLRNEMMLKLGDFQHLMRADVDAIRGIENDLRKGFFKIHREFLEYEFGTTHIVTVLFQGLKGAGSTLSVEQVAKVVVENGLDDSAAAALDFLTIAMKGQSLGKSKQPAAT